MKQKAVLIRGFGNANQTVSPYRLKALDENSAAVRSSRLAYAMAGVTAEDIVHVNSTIALLIRLRHTS